MFGNFNIDLSRLITQGKKENSVAELNEILDVKAFDELLTIQMDNLDTREKDKSTEEEPKVIGEDNTEADLINQEVVDDKNEESLVQETSGLTKENDEDIKDLYPLTDLFFLPIVNQESKMVPLASDIKDEAVIDEQINLIHETNREMNKFEAEPLIEKITSNLIESNSCPKEVKDVQLILPTKTIDYTLNRDNHLQETSFLLLNEKTQSFFISQKHESNLEFSNFFASKAINSPDIINQDHDVKVSEEAALVKWDKEILLSEEIVEEHNGESIGLVGEQKKRLVESDFLEKISDIVDKEVILSTGIKELLPTPDIQAESRLADYSTLNDLGATKNTFTEDTLPKVISNITDKGTVIENGQSTSFKLVLKPDSLGELEVSISKEDGKISADFIVKNNTSKEMLEDQLSFLKV